MELMKIVGQVAGLGGIALGMFLIIGRDIVRKNIFSSLTKEQSFKLINTLIILTWSLAAFGVAGWLYLEVNNKNNSVKIQTGIHNEGTLTVEGDLSVKGSKGN